MLRILTFRLHQPDKPFKLDKLSTNPFYTGALDTSILANSSITASAKELSEQFNNLVINNAWLWTIINQMCDWEDKDDIEGFSDLKGVSNIFTYEGESMAELMPYGLPDKLTKDKVCRKFKQRYRAYGEVLNRDQDALTKVVNNVELYVTLAFQDDIYQGHIYTWISPTDSNYCFSMGIRNRVDALILRELDSSDLVRGVSYYLFEGVRRLALAKGCSEIYVATPTRIMRPILEKLQFVKSPVRFSLTGKSLAKTQFFGQGIMDNAYKLTDPIIPVVTNDLHYLLID